MSVNIQYVEVTLSDTQSENTATITAVDQSKTLLLITGFKASNDTGLDEFRRQLAAVFFTSNTEIKVRRRLDEAGVGTVNKTYGVWVIEDDDFSVQRGEVTANAYPNSVTITSVTQTNSAIFVNIEGDAGSAPEKLYIPVVHFDSSTQFTMSINATTSIFGAGKHWQVVECSRWTTQDISASTTFGNTSNKTITSVDTSKTWHIVQGAKNGSGMDGYEQVYSQITSSTNLQFLKIDSDSEYYLMSAFVIEDSAASVQRNIISISSSATATDTISAIDTDYSFMAVCAGSTGQCTPADNTTNEPGNKDFCLSTIENSTTVQVERYNTGVRPGKVSYEVVELDISEILDDRAFQRGIEIGVYRGVEHAR